MGLSAVGRQASTTIIGGAYEMWLQGQDVTAMIVAFCAVIAPASYILFMLTVLIAVRRPPAPHWVGEMLRWADSMQPWSMSEVMMLGILVALIKIAELATVEPGIGMYGVGGLIVLFAAIMVTFHPREVWQRIEWAEGKVPPRTDATGAERRIARRSRKQKEECKFHHEDRSTKVQRLKSDIQKLRGLRVDFVIRVRMFRRMLNRTVEKFVQVKITIDELIR